MRFSSVGRSVYGAPAFRSPARVLSTDLATMVPAAAYRNLTMAKVLESLRSTRVDVN
jgi:hypothetical protein